MSSGQQRAGDEGREAPEAFDLVNSAAPALRAALGRLEVWSRYVLTRPLRAYQWEAGQAVLGAMGERRGGAITVMMSRQAGKNELSAQLEAFLLARNQLRSESMVKAAPTFKPQTVNSMLRLSGLLDNPITAGRWRREHGYILRVGRSRIFFFSAAPDAQIVGATASLLLEVDEAQDVDPLRYDRDLSPMVASTGALRVLYGTAWDDQGLLYRQSALNRELEARDGVRRHFSYPWAIVAEHNPAYGAFVEAERERLGPDHPLFVTQYELREIGQEDRLFGSAALRGMRGDHPADESPGAGVYVAGVDVAGPAEEVTDSLARERTPRKDSTVVLIGRVAGHVAEPDEGYRPEARAVGLEVVRAEWWTGRRHLDQVQDLVTLLRRWGVSRVAVDATGLGSPLAEALGEALGDRVEAVRFSGAEKSELGYALLASAGTGRLRWYRHGPDDLAATEWWHEAECCRREVRPNRLMRWFVPKAAGHDDFISAAALLVRAGSMSGATVASAVVAGVDPYAGEAGRF